ncbi:MAG: dipeptidyl peptidase 3 [Bacteroides sp.]|nr:dipeptidyl peptidase 3 [Bacteroides sp.]MCM1086353.1 dipeptidyl peptidase 3 [Bacteroides sp.]
MKEKPDKIQNFRYTIDRFADLKVMRYRVPGWEELSLPQKELLYCLSMAANAGRDILYAQNYRYNILIKRVLEAIYKTYSGKRDTEDFKNFEIYLKRFWFSNGIHHHYACDKFLPAFSRQYLKHCMENSDLSGVFAQLQECAEKDLRFTDTDSLCAFVGELIFDEDLAQKRINLDPKKGLVEASACNYYMNVGTAEAENFYARQKESYEKEHPEAKDRPLSYGLNSRLSKRNGQLKEEVCRIGGLYSQALEKIVFWLQKAAEKAESDAQKRHIGMLIDYYTTGSLKTWDDYNVLWTQDCDSFADYNNGFIETYGDPLGIKASWEAIANFRNEEATRRTEIISQNAQWFEDHSPVDKRFRKEKVKGISAKVITVVQLGGDCFPTPPIGINLPNADWIRRDYGSKSVTIENLTDAYDKSAKELGGMLQEFAFCQEEIDRAKASASVGDNLHTDLHECLGHGSGKMLEGVVSEALKSYASTLEEARADLFALYYMMDDKMQELGLLPDKEPAKAEYDGYMRNGLMTQLVRVEYGKEIEEAHMRNRSLIARWAYEKGLAQNVVEKVVREGKTYFKINDYERLRTLFAELLAEVQRIKSEGDYEAGRALVENYGVKVDAALHREVLERYKKLNLAPYGGFVNPELTPVYDQEGKLSDIEISYPDDFAAQMMAYAERYSSLPIIS